jgi:hypothetical protein
MSESPKQSGAVCFVCSKAILSGTGLRLPCGRTMHLVVECKVDHYSQCAECSKWYDEHRAASAALVAALSTQSPQVEAFTKKLQGMNAEALSRYF